MGEKCSMRPKSKLEQSASQYVFDQFRISQDLNAGIVDNPYASEVPRRKSLNTLVSTKTKSINSNAKSVVDLRTPILTPTTKLIN